MSSLPLQILEALQMLCIISAQNTPTSELKQQMNQANLAQNAFSLTFTPRFCINVSVFPFTVYADITYIMATAILASSMCY